MKNIWAYISAFLAGTIAGLFDNNTLANNFSYCFYNDINIISAVPTLWLSYPSAIGTGCFYNCTNATNYIDIPAAWK